MRKLISSLCILSLLAMGNVSAQGERRKTDPGAVDPTTGLPAKPGGPHFDLDFPGGDPETLLQDIAHAAGVRPNAIIQSDCKDVVFPRLRLRDVTASQVFQALNLSLTFATPGQSVNWQPSANNDGEIWVLLRRSRGDSTRPKVCKVFNLSPYLGQFTVEDITTAAQGAWDLMKAAEKPTIKYHKDTKLLIAVGEEDKVLVIADVLRELMAGMSFGKDPNSNSFAKPQADPKAAANRQ